MQNQIQENPDLINYHKIEAQHNNTVQLENPEKSNSNAKRDSFLEDDYQQRKLEKIRRIQKEVTEYNVNVFKERARKKQQQQQRQKEIARELDRRTQQQLERDLFTQQLSKRNERASLFNYYKLNENKKDRLRMQNKKIDKYYTELQNQETDKYEEDRIRDLEKVFRTNSKEYNIPIQKIKTEGYENAIKKDRTKNHCDYINQQVILKKKIEQLEKQKVNQWQKKFIEVDIKIKKELNDQQQLRKIQQKEQLKRYLQRQINEKNQQKTMFPPIVQYQKNRFSFG